MPDMSDNNLEEPQIGVTTERSFLERVKQRMIDDRAHSKTFLTGYHEWCIRMYEYYHNSENYVNLRKKNRFPSTAIQKDIDVFVSDTRDKLFYANRPCTIIGREDDDKEDGEVKQEFMDYQDAEDYIFSKTGLFLRDVALYRMCVAQVDYLEKKRREWVLVDIPAVFRDDDGQPIVDETGEMEIIIDPETGVPIPSGEKEWSLEDVPDYMGSTVKRIDPMNLFFTQDKGDVEDEFSLMVRSQQNKRFFTSKPYFFNQHELKQQERGQTGGDITLNDVARKRQTTNPPLTNTVADLPFDYQEWYGMVDKRELYEFEQQRIPIPDQQFQMKMATVKPNERVWAIGGLVDGEIVVQLREEPFKLGRPNIVVGYMASDEEGLIGLSLSQKIEHVQRAEEDTFGMLMANLKQSINAMWIINENALVDEEPLVNKAGLVLKTNVDPSKVALRVEQPQVASDLYTVLGIWNVERQGAGGIQPNIEGKGDPNAETLGEATQALAQATLRLRDYLKTFEDSFIRPLYRMRNHINATFIDEDYVYRLLGERGALWRKITPGQIRVSVDFICESASRETNRAILIQQMLQLGQIAPLALQAGQPVRFDKLLAELAKVGFNWHEDKIKEIFPLLKLEEQQEEGGFDIDMMLAQGAMAQMGIAATAPSGATSPGQQLPQPRSESGAVEANQQRNQTQVGRT